MKPNLFSLLYLVTAAAFAAIGLARSNVEALLTAGFALLCAIGSLFDWWRQAIVRMGRRGCFITAAIAIFGALTVQVYGLINQSFGFSYFLIGFIILMLIGTVEDAVVLKHDEAVRKTLPNTRRNQ